MRELKRHIVVLTILELAILAIGKTLNIIPSTKIDFANLAILSLAFFLITSIAFAIFDIGRHRKKSKNQGSHSLISFGVKFTAELVLIFFYFFIAKKTDVVSLLSFFILYLAFTTLWMIEVIKVLRNSNL